MVVESAGCHTRSVSGFLSLLLKAHFPGLVQFGRKEEPPYRFAHYANAPDARDLLSREFPNKAERVKVELWVSLPRTTLFNTSHSLDIF
jgi:hypothetical protein